LKLNAIEKDYVPGKDGKILKTPLGKIGVLICNENLYPDYAGRITRSGAEFFLVVANDSLLIDRLILNYHFLINRYRAVENRRDVVVASNGGISGLIDACGRLVVRSGAPKSECIPCEVKKSDYAGFYSKFGNLFTYFCVFCSILSIIITSYLFCRRRKIS
jgi:apolipoprotein N-acyltransferase